MTHASAPSISKSKNLGLWVAQILLALLFGMAGFMKTTQPIEVLAENLGWPGLAPAALVRFIGITEFLAAVGLILPTALRYKAWLTPLAAAGLVVVMILAAILHIVQGEFSGVGVNAVLGALAAFVAWGRK